MRIIMLLPLLIIPLSANPSWFGSDEKSSEDSNYTTIDIDGGFGLKLGSRYNQDFIKPASPTEVFINFEEAGNWVGPSKPIDILSRYKLYVDDNKIAWGIYAIGQERKGDQSCKHDKRILIKAIEKKYSTKYVKGNSVIARNTSQNREIEVFCLPVKVLDYNGEPPGIFGEMSKHESTFRLIIKYTDKNIKRKYSKKLDKERETKENSRINSYDI